MMAPCAGASQLAVFVSLLGVQNAWADETITAIFPDRFGSAVTTIDQGEKVTLQELDIGRP